MQVGHAGRAAVGHIGVPSVMGLTQCQSATKRTNSENSYFCDLPEGIVTPIRVDRLHSLLTNFPDQERVQYVIAGLRLGFDIGFVGEFSDTNTRPNNLLSARTNVAKVSQAINKEVQRKHTSGPFLEQPFVHTHCSPVGPLSPMGQ